VPEKATEAAIRPVMLEKRLLDTPEVALEYVRREIARMAKTAKMALTHSLIAIMEDNRKELKPVEEIEDFIDSFQLEITSYLTELLKRHPSEEVAVELPVLLHAVNDLERIGDHSVNIAEIAQRKLDQRLVFSDRAKAEAEELRKESAEMFDDVITALENNDTAAAKAALVIENKLNRMQIDFRRSHVNRMSEGMCGAEAGLIFIDLVDNVEKVGDHLTNIAQAVIGGLQWMGIEPRVLPEF
jgi:phosphate:Na+ symporter